MNSSRIFLDGDELRLRRIAAELDLADLAELTGLDRTHIGKMERGLRGTTAKTLGRIARALNCKPTDLLLPPAKAAA